MSRSPRRRKDTAWCRSCDAALAPRNGLGKHRDCERERRHLKSKERDRKRIEREES